MSTYGILDSHVMGEQDYLRGLSMNDHPLDMTDLEVDNYQNAWALAALRDPENPHGSHGSSPDLF